MLNVYDRKNAAKLLGLSKETIDRYRKGGKLPYRKIGDRIMFTEKDLNAFLDACAIPATVALSNREKLELIKSTGGDT